MGFGELFLVAIGLSMDAFAVAICKGLEMKKLNYSHAVIIAAFFGGFQAAMPLLGWALGQQFAQYIMSYDHWIAFILLTFIGSKMLKDGFQADDEFENYDYQLDLKELTLLAVATSIDALAVGITFAFLQVTVVPAIIMIGITTFVLSLLGVALGNNFGVRYKGKAEIAGGLILIFIGTKILFEHLSIF